MRIRGTAARRERYGSPMTDVVTDRLALRAYAPEDEDHFVGILGDPRVTRWMGVPTRPLREVFRSVVTAEPAWDIWAIWAGDVYVGHGELKPSPDPHVDGHELVYALVPDAWGRGLGTEIAEGITKHGLETLGLDAVHATVAPENEASLRLLRRLGYVDAGSWVDDDGDETLWLVRRG